MKIKEILADVFLLQFSQSEVVDGNAVKKTDKGQPQQNCSCVCGMEKLQP